MRDPIDALPDLNARPDIVDPTPISPAEYAEVQKRRKEGIVKELTRKAHEKISEGLKTTSKRAFVIEAPGFDDGLLPEVERAAQLVKEYFEQSGWEVEVEGGWSYMCRLRFNIPGTRAAKKGKAPMVVGIVAAAVLAIGFIGSAAFYMSRPEQPRSNIESLDPEIASSARSAGFMWVDPNVTASNFPDAGASADSFRIFSFVSAASFNEVVADMRARGYQPANLQELLIYSKDLSNSKDFVYALGQGWRDQWGYLRFPTASYGERRSIYLTWHNDWWPKDSKFLAVPIQKLEK